MTKTLDYIFIDTCVFIRESIFKKSGGVSRLFDLAEQGWIKILMPEIAKREWFKHFEDKTFLKFEEVEKKAVLMGNTNNANEFVKSHKELTASYETLVRNSFEEHLKRAGVVIIPTSYANDTLESVVDRYFKKEKPFGDKGKEKEFPDAFILASLEKYAKEKGIPQIKVFSTDGDINLYNNELFIKEEAGQYLNDFISKRIPEHEQEEKCKRDGKDISRLTNYLKDGFCHYEKQVHDHVEVFLSDVALYEERFNYADIEEAYVESVKVGGSIKDMELLSVDDEAIRALCYVDVDAIVKVNHFCEEDSIWDSEDKKYIYEKYENTSVELSSVVKVIFEMDRTELEMGQEPSVAIHEIDTDDLEEVIDGDYREPRRYVPPTASSTNLNAFVPTAAILALTEEANKSINPVRSAISSMSVLQASLQQLKTPEVIKGMQQMAAINGTWAETIKSIQRMQDNLPMNVFASMTDIIAKMGPDKDKIKQPANYSCGESKY